jgi:uridylate kinase
MDSKIRILLKLTGELVHDAQGNLASRPMLEVIAQIKKLSLTHSFGIVLGGGAFFRGSIQGKALGLTSQAGHYCGMLATMMNGIIFKDLLDQHNINATLFTALSTPEIGSAISQQAIQEAQEKNHVLIFTGGTGNPYFTTDTNAILRGLQIQAHEIWKGTNVAGIYDCDPRSHLDAQFIKKLTYHEALERKLSFMDATALALAQEHCQKIRVFDIYSSDALIKAAQDQEFGSLITR